MGLDDFQVSDHKVMLGMTRLAIVDLSEAGEQPLISSCGNYVLIFDGEIYNHLELRKKLPAIIFKGYTGAETALYYIMEYGIERIKDFNGTFGFSFLDISNERLYLVRDQFGVKPVYWFCKDNNFLFSSEIRPINYILRKIEPDLNNLSTLLRLRYLPSPLTPYQQINKLRPGHYLEVDLSSKEIKFREKNFAEYAINPLTKNKSVLDGYGHKIEEAVKRQLVSDVEVGILLSGGIDSAVVAALAQKHSSDRLKAFTIGFEGDHVEDEIEAAAETAELLGLEHFSKTINFENFLSIFKKTIHIVEEPLATTSAIPMCYLSKLASQYVKVVLTGQGADEPLGGYQRYQGELISGKIPRGMISAFGKSISFLPIKNERLLRAFYALGEKNDVERFLKIYSIFQQNEIKTLLNITDEKSYDLVSYFYNLQKERKISPVERMMAIDLRMNLSDDLLLYTDKIAMNFSLECRVPMLDVELIKYIESLPVDQRLAVGKTKIIHKSFANKILPQKIVNRKKMGFDSPTQVWFNTYNEQIKDLLLSSRPFIEIFNPSAVLKLLNQHLKGYNKEKQIFLLLGIYYWLEYVNNSVDKRDKDIKH